MKILFFWLFVIVQLIECNELCPINSSDTNIITSENLLQTLFDLCCNDNDCANTYYQIHRKNITVFRHLLSSEFISQKMNNLFSPIQDLLCGKNSNLQDINNQLWLMLLIINKEKSQPQCDVNHHLVFDESGLKSHCTCKSDRICSDGIYDLIPFYILIGLVALLSILFVSTGMYKDIKILKAVDNVTKFSNGGANALNKLVS